VSPTLVWSMGACASTDRPTDCVRPIHVILIRCTCLCCHTMHYASLVPRPHPKNNAMPRYSAVRNGDIATRPRTESEKQRHPCNELRGWNERETSEPLYASASLSKSSSLAFSYVSFSRWSLHTNPFLQFST